MYIREKKEGKLREFPFPKFWHLRIEVHVVGFCGRIIPAIQTSNMSGYFIPTPLYHYTQESFEEFVKTWGKRDQKEYFDGKFSSWGKDRFSRSETYWKINRATVEHFFTNFPKTLEKDNPISKLMEQFHNPPIFSLSNRQREPIVTFNCSLKDLQFYKFIPVAQTFQELYVYLSNQANPEKPIPKVSDEDLAFSKGFNKFSFRKDKKEKK